MNYANNQEFNQEQDSLTRETFNKYGTMFFGILVGFNIIDLIMQFIDPDFGQLQIIAIIKASTAIPVFLVGLFACRMLSLKLLKLFGILLIARYLVMTALVFQFLFIGNSLLSYSTGIFNNLDQNYQQETSVNEIKRVVMTQEMAGILFSGLFVGVGTWLLIRYYRILEKLNTNQNVPMAKI